MKKKKKIIQLFKIHRRLVAKVRGIERKEESVVDQIERIPFPRRKRERGRGKSCSEYGLPSCSKEKGMWRALKPCSTLLWSRVTLSRKVFIIRQDKSYLAPGTPQPLALSAPEHFTALASTFIFALKSALSLRKSFNLKLPRWRGSLVQRTKSTTTSFTFQLFFFAISPSLLFLLYSFQFMYS